MSSAPVGGTGREASGPVSPARPLILVFAAAVGVIVLVAAVVVAARVVSDDDGCVRGLARHLPSDVEVLQGSDLVAARRAGFDDSDPRALARSLFETGILPDMLTARQLNRQRKADIGYEPADLACWLGGGGDEMAARGAFDPDAIARGEAADEVVVRGALLVTGDDREARRRGTDPGAAVIRVLDEFAAQRAVSFVATSPGDDAETWAGVGLSRVLEDWQLVIVWAFPDSEAAQRAEGEIFRIIAEGGSRIGEVVEGDPADRLERDGSTLSLGAPLAQGPDRWITLFQRLDPVLTVGR